MALFSLSSLTPEGIVEPSSPRRVDILQPDRSPLEKRLPPWIFAINRATLFPSKNHRLRLSSPGAGNYRVRAPNSDLCEIIITAAQVKLLHVIARLLAIIFPDTMGPVVDRIDADCLCAAAPSIFVAPAPVLANLFSIALVTFPNSDLMVFQRFLGDD